MFEHGNCEKFLFGFGGLDTSNETAHDVIEDLFGQIGGIVTGLGSFPIVAGRSIPISGLRRLFGAAETDHIY